MSVLERLAEDYYEKPDRPYLPFSVALESGVLDLDSVVRRELVEPIGVTLANGKIPQQNDAGVVGIGGESIVAVDHAQVTSINNTKIEISPSDKQSVDKGSGMITSEGIITLTNLEGLMKVIGMAVIRNRAEWMRVQNRLRVGIRASGLAIIQFGIEAKDFEVDDMDPVNGFVTAKPRRNYW